MSLLPVRLSRPVSIGNRQYRVGDCVHVDTYVADGMVRRGEGAILSSGRPATPAKQTKAATAEALQRSAPVAAVVVSRQSEPASAPQVAEQAPNAPKVAKAPRASKSR
jgi:ABC-type hemin transport system substrate-binding protein